MVHVYSADRRGCYEVGKHLKLITPNELRQKWNESPFDDKKTALEEFLKSYPNGVSNHGFAYFINLVSEQDVDTRRSQSIELFYEAIRLAYYPERPSRLTSYFGCQNLQDIQDFIGNNDYSIYLLETDDYFKADMELLKWDDSGFVTFDYAHQYWQGKLSTSPKVEILLSNPKVIERIA